jgi:hypothetical protein
MQHRHAHTHRGATKSKAIADLLKGEHILKITTFMVLVETICT